MEKEEKRLSFIKVLIIIIFPIIGFIIFLINFNKNKKYAIKCLIITLISFLLMISVISIFIYIERNQRYILLEIPEPPPKEIIDFNYKFEKYNGDNKKSDDVKAFIKTILDSNANEPNSKMILILDGIFINEKNINKIIDDSSNIYTIRMNEGVSLDTIGNGSLNKYLIESFSYDIYNMFDGRDGRLKNIYIYNSILEKYKKIYNHSSEDVRELIKIVEQGNIENSDFNIDIILDNKKKINSDNIEEIIDKTKKYTIFFYYSKDSGFIRYLNKINITTISE